MDVSENSGTPKSSILVGFSIINHPFWGTTIFGNTHFNQPDFRSSPKKSSEPLMDRFDLPWRFCVYHDERVFRRFSISPKGAMGLEYLPTFTYRCEAKCRQIYQDPMDSSKIYLDLLKMLGKSSKTYSPKWWFFIIVIYHGKKFKRITTKNKSNNIFAPENQKVGR